MKKEISKEVSRLESKRKARRADKNRKVRAATFGKKKNKLPTIRQMFGGVDLHPEAGARFAQKVTRNKKKNRASLSLKAKHKRRLKRKLER